MPLQYRLLIPVFAYWVSNLVAGTTSRSHLFTFVLALGAVELLVFAFSRLAAHRTAPPLPDRVSVDDARAMARAALLDPTRFVVVASAPGSDWPIRSDQLASHIREFFEMYDSVETAGGGARLDRRQVGPSSLDSQFIQIGTDAVEGTHIAVRPHGEDVYEIDGTEPPGHQFESDPTIWHWLLRMDTELRHSS